MPREMKLGAFYRGEQTCWVWKRVRCVNKKPTGVAV